MTYSSKSKKLNSSKKYNILDLDQKDDSRANCLKSFKCAVSKTGKYLSDMKMPFCWMKNEKPLHYRSGALAGFYSGTFMGSVHGGILIGGTLLDYLDLLPESSLWSRFSCIIGVGLLFSLPVYALFLMLFCFGVFVNYLYKELKN